MQFYTDSSSETLPRFYFFQDEVLHGLIIKVTPHRFPFSNSRHSFTRTRYQSNLTQVPSPFQIQFYTNSSSRNSTQVSFFPRMQFYTDSSSVNPTQVSFSISDVVLHGLIIRKPYTRFPSQLQMKFYTDSSSDNPTPVPSLQDAVLHGLVTKKPYTCSLFPKM